MVKIEFRVDERDHLHSLIREYQTNPFTGECYIDEVSFQKIGKFYHMIFTEEQIEKFKIKEDFLAKQGAHQFMFMIKPTAQDNNYIFFRRV